MAFPGCLLWKTLRNGRQGVHHRRCMLSYRAYSSRPVISTRSLRNDTSDLAAASSAAALASAGAAFTSGNGHLIPLLTRVWPLPDDLRHAAGAGDFANVLNDHFEIADFLLQHGATSIRDGAGDRRVRKYQSHDVGV